MNAILAVAVSAVVAVYLLIGVVLAFAVVVEAALLDTRLRWRWVWATLIAWPLCLMIAGKRAAEQSAEQQKSEPDAGGAR